VSNNALLTIPYPNQKLESLDDVAAEPLTKAIPLCSQTRRPQKNIPHCQHQTSHRIMYMQTFDINRLNSKLGPVFRINPQPILKTSL
jgi:hypothetical protein